LEVEVVTRSRSLRWIGIILVPVVFIGLVGWATFTRPARVIPGKEAPNFELISFEGERRALRDFRGRPVMLNFWASWCVPCRDEAPDLAATSRRYENSEMVMIGINTQDLMPDATAFIDRHDIGYLNLRDSEGKVTTLYGVRAFPETFFISREGIILEHIFGPMSSPELRSKIERALDKGV
jgi:cytochrome c biogenesis protein CcmG/thiol:disulfide interchange protein DsbE